MKPLYEERAVQSVFPFFLYVDVGSLEVYQFKIQAIVSQRQRLKTYVQVVDKCQRIMLLVAQIDAIQCQSVERTQVKAFDMHVRTYLLRQPVGYQPDDIGLHTAPVQQRQSAPRQQQQGCQEYRYVYQNFFHTVNK